MFTKAKMASRGFTVMELLIVIVIFGILTSVVLSSLQGVHRQARDTERRTDLDNIHANLELYWHVNGSYPVDIGAGSLVNLNPEVAFDPNGSLITSSTSESTNGPVSGYSSDRPDGAQYAYAGYSCSGVADADDTNTDTATASCSKYILYGWLEEADISGQSVYQLNSLN